MLVFSPPGDLPYSKTEPISPASLALAGRFFYHCNMWEEVISKYKLPEFFKYKDPGPKREVRDKNSIMSQLVWTYFNIKNLEDELGKKKKNPRKGNSKQLTKGQ